MFGGPSIPTYEEATAAANRDATAAGEGGSYEERAGLLGGGGREAGSNYRPPTVEDARNSMDSLSPSRRSSEESLNREILQFEIMDGEEDVPSSSSRRQTAYHHLRKRMSTLASTVSSSLHLRLPSISFGRLRGISFRVPQLPCTKCVESIIPYYRLLGLFLVIMIVYFLLASDLFNFRGRAVLGQVFDPETVQAYAVDYVEKDRISQYLQYLTSFGHVAGTDGDRTLAKYIEGEFKSFQFDAVTNEDFEVYLNYPTKQGRGVEIVEPAELRWSADIEEVSGQTDPAQPLVFHGYSKSGDVKGPLVYVNFGRKEDYEELTAKGVGVKGAVVLVRESGAVNDMGMVVKMAERMGAVGCLIGRGDWGVTGSSGEENAVRRGSVALRSLILGDALTPGWPSMPDQKRIAKEESMALVGIPSLPISRNNAHHLVSTLKDLGIPLTHSSDPTIATFWSGNISSSPIVRLQNKLVEVERQRITNVLGTIKGIEQIERKVIIGNHRDSFCFGAGTPNSGTAVMLEVAKVFGDMMGYGWRPLRTIVFASWDAGEYNSIGSTEWVELHDDDLRRNGLVYINLGTAVTGPFFHASGSPPLEHLLRNVLSRIEDPKTKNRLSTLWASDMPHLGSSSDFGAFQHRVGISSIDIGFHHPISLNKNTVYPDLSCDDTFLTMAADGDRGWEYHEAIARILALLILNVADASDIGFNMTHYAVRTASWLDELEAFATTKAKASKRHPLDLTPLKSAVALMRKNMEIFDAKPSEWNDIGATGDPSVTAIHRISHNARMANFEHHLTEDDGVWGRAWFRHMLVAPNRGNAGAVTYFPSVWDAVDTGDWKVAAEMVKKVAERLTKASEKILN